LSQYNLATYYNTNFTLAQHHDWSLTEIDALIPFEREIYINMLENFLKEQAERLEKNG
tara:strand:+ start:918 stop:1091 length:174 start_codon:yes stop_codon:yes gene_type:complete